MEVKQKTDAEKATDKAIRRLTNQFARVATESVVKEDPSILEDESILQMTDEQIMEHIEKRKKMRGNK